MHSLASLNDQAVLQGLRQAFKRERAGLAELLAYIGEVDARRLYAPEGYETITSFVTGELGLREWEAGNRITAARLTRRFPLLLGMIERGEICLTSLTKLGPALTVANCEEVLAQAKVLTTREVEKLRATLDGEVALAGSGRPGVLWSPPLALDLETSPPANAQVVATGSNRGAETQSTRGAETRSTTLVVRSDSACLPEKVKYLTPDIVELRIRAEEALLKVIDEVSALARAKGIKGGLAEVLTHVGEDYLDRHHPERRLARKVAARAAKERKSSAKNTQGAEPVGLTDVPARSSRYIPQEVKDASLRRYGYRCAYASPTGRACNARHGLQFDHIIPVAIGGSSTDPANIRPLCATHNRMMAERVFGKDFIAGKIAAAQARRRCGRQSNLGGQSQSRRWALPKAGR